MCTTIHDLYYMSWKTKLNPYPMSLIHITFIENGPIVFETMKDEQSSFLCFTDYIFIVIII